MQLETLTIICPPDTLPCLKAIQYKLYRWKSSSGGLQLAFMNPAMLLSSSTVLGGIPVVSKNLAPSLLAKFCNYRIYLILLKFLENIKMEIQFQTGINISIINVS